MPDSKAASGNAEGEACQPSTDLAGGGGPLMSASEWTVAPGLGGSDGLDHNGRTTR